MTRMQIQLTFEERVALLTLAKLERRGCREQAALIVCQELERRGLLPLPKNQAALIDAAEYLLFAAEQALMALKEGYDTPKIRQDLKDAIEKAKGQREC